MLAKHIPISAEYVVRQMIETGGHVFLDLTIGGASYFELLLKKLQVRLDLYGIDSDPEAIKMSKARLRGAGNVNLVCGRHGRLSEYARTWNVSHFDAIIGDFGLSSDQLDDPGRGFSHRLQGPLDMRYSPETDLTAADIINTFDKRELAGVIRKYGGERLSGPVAAEIIKNRPLETTTQLARIVRKVCAGRHVEKSLARVMMAFRMVVNQELEEIESVLPVAFDLLRPGGRMIMISYGSDHDSIIKRFFKDGARKCICPVDAPVCTCRNQPRLKLLTKKPVRPDTEEISRNPRASSALLRVAEKL